MAVLLVEHLEVAARIDVEHRMVGGAPAADTAGAVHKLVAEVKSTLDLAVFVLLADVFRYLAVLLDLTEGHHGSDLLVDLQNLFGLAHL